MNVLVAEPELEEWAARATGRGSQSICPNGLGKPGTRPKAITGTDGEISSNQKMNQALGSPFFVKQPGLSWSLAPTRFHSF